MKLKFIGRFYKSYEKEKQHSGLCRNTASFFTFYVFLSLKMRTPQILMEQ